MAQALDRTFAALSDPTRRAILARLAEGEATVSEIAAPFLMSQPSISRHLKVLEDAGLILRRVDGNRRPCRLAPDTLGALEDWLDHVRRIYAANYDRLDAVLNDLQSQEPKT
ncbi:ArsR/SmtB family transcription factor [Flavimaricola marinus]|uniref:HTH-type transcriptional regulator n=1 Tax=Flavimaricola marinus TaxID=1819565 RepID=A0A238LFD3_9RHOB|nr:metalloregulator ArsR/SmtB family transcription factor [Flavimaricola marinus]SMY08283.1 HTH-type transcriptional regulator [Flavimaricola marinus]